MNAICSTLVVASIIGTLLLATAPSSAAPSEPSASTPVSVTQIVPAAQPSIKANSMTEAKISKVVESGMSASNLTGLVSLILALSIASERLVEIIKGFVPMLNKAISSSDDKSRNAEGRRQAYIQILAVVSGIFTAYLSRNYIPQEIAAPTETWTVLGLGLLASGGSGFWNSVLGYVTKLKDIKKVEVDVAKKALAQ